MIKREKFRLNVEIYRGLLTVLARYTQLPEARRPPLLEFRAWRTRADLVRFGVRQRFFVKEAAYMFSFRPSIVKQQGRGWYMLTAKSVAIIKWWMELGYDVTALDEGRFPPYEWEEEYDTDDYIRPQPRSKKPPTVPLEAEVLTDYGKPYAKPIKLTDKYNY